MGRTLCRFDLSSSHGVLTKVGATSRSGTYPTLNWVIAVPEDRFVAKLLVEIRDAAVCDEAVVVTDEMLSFAINRGIGIMGLRHISFEVQLKIQLWFVVITRSGAAIFRARCRAQNREGQALSSNNGFGTIEDKSDTARIAHTTVMLSWNGKV